MQLLIPAGASGPFVAAGCLRPISCQRPAPGRTVRGTVRTEFGRRRLGAGMLWIGLPVYALVTAVAVVPDLASLVGLEPRQLEGILIALVLLLGINAAWFLAMEPEAAATTAPTGSRAADSADHEPHPT